MSTRERDVLGRLGSRPDTIQDRITRIREAKAGLDEDEEERRTLAETRRAPRPTIPADAPVEEQVDSVRRHAGIVRQEGRQRQEQGLQSRIDTIRAAKAELDGEVETASTGDGEEDLVEIEDPGAGRDLLASTLQGATLGFSDELGAAVRAAPRLVPGGKSFVESYRENVEAAREGLEAAREDMPIGSRAAELGGALGSAVATGGQSLLARPVVGGAIGGGVAGAGVAQGGLVERLKGAAGGTAIGGATGGALNLAGRLFAPVGARIVDFIRPQTDEAATAVGRAARKAAPVQSVRDRALSKVRGALEREGIEDVTAVRELAEGAQPGQTIMDVAGDPGNAVQRLARGAESIPSKGAARLRKFLVERASQAPTRIKKALQEKTGLTFEDAVQTLDELAARRAAQARPLYEEAYEKTVQITDDVADAFKLPQFQEAYERGRRIAAAEGVELPPLPGPLKGRTTTRGVGSTQDIPVQGIDYMKRGLDDVIDTGRRSSRGMGRNEARVIRNRLNRLLQEVDEQVPEYAAARGQYAGDSAALEAFEKGLDDFAGGPRSSADPREVAKKVGQMTDSEKEFYRRGALDALRQRLETVTDFGRNPDVTRRVVGNEELRGRVRQLFDSPQDFEDFLDLMVLEQNMVKGGQFVRGGSPTARIQAEQADLGRQPLGLSDITSPREVVRRVLEGVEGRARAINERTVDELEPFLTREMRGSGAGLADELEAWLEREASRRAQRALLTRGGAMQAGLLSGGNGRDTSGGGGR